MAASALDSSGHFGFQIAANATSPMPVPARNAPPRLQASSHRIMRAPAQKKASAAGSARIRLLPLATSKATPSAQRPPRREPKHAS